MYLPVENTVMVWWLGHKRSQGKFRLSKKFQQKRMFNCIIKMFTFIFIISPSSDHSKQKKLNVYLTTELRKCQKVCQIAQTVDFFVSQIYNGGKLNFYLLVLPLFAPEKKRKKFRTKHKPHAFSFVGGVGGGLH